MEESRKLEFLPTSEAVRSAILTLRMAKAEESQAFDALSDVEKQYARLRHTGILVGAVQEISGGLSNGLHGNCRRRVAVHFDPAGTPTNRGTHRTERSGS